MEKLNESDDGKQNYDDYITTVYMPWLFWLMRPSCDKMTNVKAQAYNR